MGSAIMSTDQKIEHPKTAWRFLVTYRRSIITCAVVALVTSQRYAAFTLLFVLLPFFVWSIYSLIVAYKNPQRRKWQLTRVAIWLMTFVLIGGVHWLRHQTTRTEADRIAVAVDQYKNKNGVYPANMEAIGEDSKNLRRESLLIYAVTDGVPLLSYGSTLAPFDRYSYDFGRAMWIFIPD
jgi:hypothetical protein